MPEPQITDMEMEQIVKLGKASEAARENVTQEAGEGGSTRASDALLAGRGTNSILCSCWLFTIKD